jgi:hypothetical protein
MTVSEIRMPELHAVAREAGDKHGDIKLKASSRYGRESLKDLLEVEAISLISEYRAAIEARPRPVMPPMISRLPRLKVPRPAQKITPMDAPPATAAPPARDPEDLRGAPKPSSLQGMTDDGVWVPPPGEEVAAWQAMPCNHRPPRNATRCLKISRSVTWKSTGRRHQGRKEACVRSRRRKRRGSRRTLSCPGSRRTLQSRCRRCRRGFTRSPRGF